MSYIKYEVDYVKLDNDIKEIIKQIRYADRLTNTYERTITYIKSNAQNTQMRKNASRLYLLLQKVDGIRFEPRELLMNVMDILKLITYTNIDEQFPNKERFIRSNFNRILFLSTICTINDLTTELQTKPNKKSIVSKILNTYRMTLNHLTYKVNIIFKDKLQEQKDSFIQKISEQYRRYLDICIAMEQLKLPVYVILWITNEIIDYDGIDHFHMLSDSQKIDISENVRTFHNRLI